MLLIIETELIELCTCIKSRSENEMRSTKKEDKEPIPWELKRQVLKVMVDENVVWEEACRRVARMCNSVDLAKLVSLKAEALAKSRFMTSLNTGRSTIASEAAKTARDGVRNYET